jgi:hypothetical protein
MVALIAFCTMRLTGSDTAGHCVVPGGFVAQQCSPAGISNDLATMITARFRLSALTRHKLALRGGEDAEEDEEGQGGSLADRKQPLDEWIWSQDFGKTFDPLFMTGMTPEQEKAARDEFIQQIMEGEEDMEQLQDYWRMEGNKKVEIAKRLKAEGNINHTKFHVLAVVCYSKALMSNSTDVLNRAVCHANRAASHLATGNFGHAIRDSNATIAIFDVASSLSHGHGSQRMDHFEMMPPGWDASIRSLDGEGRARLRRVTLKCLLRAASACVRLDKFRAAQHYCERVQDILCESSPGRGSGGGAAAGQKGAEPFEIGLLEQVRGLMDAADAGLCEEAAERAAARRRRDEARAQRFTVADAVRRRGVLMSPPPPSLLLPLPVSLLYTHSLPP